MYSHHHYRLLHKIIHLKTKLGRIYEHLIIQTFAYTLISIFIPIYLYTLGFSLQKIFTYLLIQTIAFGLFTPLYAKIIHRVGLKEVIVFRTPISILVLYLLHILATNIWLQTHYYIIPLLEGFSFSLYVLSLTALFGKHMGRKHQSNKTAKLLAFPRMASIFSPAIGGFVALHFGFPILFFAVIILLFVSLLPILFMKENLDHPAFKYLVFKQYKKYTKEMLMLLGYSIRGMGFGVILPLALYFSFNNSFSLGLVISFILFVSSIFYLYLGKLADKQGLRNFIRLGGLMSAALLFGFGYFLNTPWLFYLSLLTGFLPTILCYETHLYQESRKHRSPLEFLAFKEFILFIGRAAFLLILIFVTTQLDVAFYISGAASLIFLFF